MEATGGKVAIVMGSQSDWPTMKAAADVLNELEVAYEARITSAHRTPDRLGVPVQSKALSGMDSLLSIVQMPGGIPVGTLAIGEAGAKNAGLLAAAILALSDEDLSERLQDWRAANSAGVAEVPED